MTKPIVTYHRSGLLHRLLGELHLRAARRRLYRAAGINKLAAACAEVLRNESATGQPDKEETTP